MGPTLLVCVLCYSWQYRDGSTSGGVEGPQCLSPPLGSALCTINCSLGRKTPAVELSCCQSLRLHHTVHQWGCLWPPASRVRFLETTNCRWVWLHIYKIEMSHVYHKSQILLKLKNSKQVDLGSCVTQSHGASAIVQSLERITFRVPLVNGGP